MPTDQQKAALQELQSRRANLSPDKVAALDELSNRWGLSPQQQNAQPIIPSPDPLANEQVTNPALRIRQLLRQPSATLTQGYQQAANGNPIAGGLNFANAIGQTVALPFGLASEGWRNVPYGGRTVSGLLNAIPETVAAGVGGGTSLLDKLTSGLPQGVKNLGMSQQNADQATQAGNQINNMVGTLLLPQVGAKVLSDAAPKVAAAIDEHQTNVAQKEIKQVAPPLKKELNYDASLKRAIPYLKDQLTQTPIDPKAELSPIRQMGDAVSAAKDKLWNGQIQDQITRHPELTVSGDNIAKSIKGDVSSYLKDIEPERAKAIEDYANRYVGDIPIAKAQEYITGLNAELGKYYNASPVERAAIDNSGTPTAARQLAVDALRDATYKSLQDVGETNVSGLRKDYGSLKQIGQAVQRNVVRVEKSAATPLPLSATRGMHLGGAAGTGLILDQVLRQLAVPDAVAVAGGIGAYGLSSYLSHRAKPMPTILRAANRLQQ